MGSTYVKACKSVSAKLVPRILSQFNCDSGLNIETETLPHPSSCKSCNFVSVLIYSNPGCIDCSSPWEVSNNVFKFVKWRMSSVILCERTSRLKVEICVSICKASIWILVHLLIFNDCKLVAYFARISSAWDEIEGQS